jgi:hypothetical protein
MSTARCGIAAALFVCSLLALPSAAAAVPITVTQTATADPVLPYLTFTNFTLTPGGWTGGMFPFTQISQISSIRLQFDSVDPDWRDGLGPGGGTVGVAIYVVNDANAGVPITSLYHSVSSLTLTPGSGSFFTTIGGLLLDGQIVFRLGAFEAFPTFSNPLTLHGLSSLRVEVAGNAPAVVPEPATVTLCGSGVVLLLFMLWARRVPVAAFPGSGCFAFPSPLRSFVDELSGSRCCEISPGLDHREYVLGGDCQRPGDAS